jgi:hypothetical protein
MLERQQVLQHERAEQRQAAAAAAAAEAAAITPVATGGGAPSPHAGAGRCTSCRIGGGEDLAGEAPLVCSACGSMWHTWCVTPPLDAAGVARARAAAEWFCPDCPDC